MKIKHKECPIKGRQAAYPDLADQVDAIYKFIKAMEGTGVPIPPETKAWLDEITRIKSTFPKKGL